MTATDILIEFLKKNKEICEHDIETLVPTYGKVYFGKVFNPATYSRKFRLARQSGILERQRIKLSPEPTQSGELKYRVVYDVQ